MVCWGMDLSDCICDSGRTKYEAVLNPECRFHFPDGNKDPLEALKEFEPELEKLQAEERARRPRKSAAELFAELNLK